MTAMMRRGLGVLLIMLLVACGQSGVTTPGANPPGQTDATTTGANPSTADTTQSKGGPVRDHVSLVDFLRGQGLQVDVVGDVQQPFLQAKGTTLRLSGGTLSEAAEIQSFNYDDTDLGTDGVKAAEADAAAIGPDGNPATMMISWVEPPHFFRKDRVIVLYLGEDAAVLKTLTDALGPQFAGR